MKSIVFLTCAKHPDGTADDRPLKALLETRGYEVRWESWDSPQFHWNSESFYCIRSTWDYYERIEAFRTWLNSAPSAVTFFNPRELIRWNIDKLYLRELEQAGIPIVPTHFISNASEASALALDPDQEWCMKPSISAGSDLTYRLHGQEYARLTQERDAILRRSHLLVQPFLSSILTDGEVSLLYFRAEGKTTFSHACLKRPKSGDYRVQGSFGGSLDPYSPSAELRALSEAALARIPGGDFLYARADWVDFKTSPKLAELELIEPDLYFRSAPGSQERFVDYLVARLNHRT